MPIAFISNGVTPYKLHIYDRITREMPEVELHVINTHVEGGSAWSQSMPSHVRSIDLSNGDAAQSRSEKRNAWREFRRGKQVIDELKRRRVRVAFVWGYDDLGRLRVIRWCRSREVACFLLADSNIRGDRVRGWRRWLKRRWVGWVVGRCTGILPCGSLGRAYFESYGADPSRIFYVPYEPDYRQIRELAPSMVGEVRDRYALAVGRRRFIYSGRLVDVKRVDVLLQAFARIADARPDWDLTILGEGPERDRLRALVPESLSSRVAWLGFAPDAEVVWSVYRCCDVLVLPSEYEPWALVINEAVASGLAVICTDVVGAAAELVRDGFNGRIVPPGDVDALAAAMIDVSLDARLADMKANAPAMLEDWRARGDPIDGLRRALRACGASPRND